MDTALVERTGEQERRFARAFALVDEAIAQKVFPGAALAVTLRGALLAWRGFGRFTYEADAPPVTRETVWDLASLTKPIATTSMAMLLCERGKLRVDTPVVELLPEFADGRDLRREQVTVRMLLAHSSGLPAHRKLYLEAQGREAVLAAARRVELEAAPMERAEYSDIGFVILGELLERVAGVGLDEFCRNEVFEPLKSGMTFVPQVEEQKGIPPTVNDLTYRGRVVQGEVNDENASALGGVAGHAGLFGDARSVAAFAGCMLRGGEPIFDPDTVRMFTQREARPVGSSRTMGWDTPSAPSQSGTRFSAGSFGHLGYTGTSLWCDSERRVCVTLLTNRTWPDAGNQAIREFRPRVHDAIASALAGE